MTEYPFDVYEPHDHIWDNYTMICVKCGITKEAVYAGRDRPPTWEDVDEAYRDGRRIGIELGQLLYKQARRLKLIEVGYWLALRRISRVNEDDAVRRAEERERDKENDD